MWCRLRRRDGPIGCMMFFGKDLDGAEVRGEAGAAELVGLLGVVSLGDENEAMTGGEVGQGFIYVGQEFDLLIGDGLGEADDALVLFRRDGTISELLEAGDERAAKAVESVAVGRDG